MFLTPAVNMEKTYRTLTNDDISADYIFQNKGVRPGAVNQKFDVSECIFNLLEGMGEPIDEILKNPGAAAAGTAAVTAVNYYYPGIMQAAGYLLAADGACDTAKYIYEAAALYKQGKYDPKKYDEAEKVFKKAGRSLVQTAPVLSGKGGTKLDLKKHNLWQKMKHEAVKSLSYIDDVIAVLSISKDDKSGCGSKNDGAANIVEEIFTAPEKPEFWYNFMPEAFK